jgi:hypothetical protein
MSTEYVVNVKDAEAAANPARGAFDRAKSLERIAKHNRDYAAVLASDEVGRIDEADELRGHADELDAKAKTIVDNLTAAATANTQAATAPASDPLPLPSLDFSK